MTQNTPPPHPGFHTGSHQDPDPAAKPLLSLDLRRDMGAFTLKVKIDAGPGITTLFGRSGAGKSTIVAMLAGLLTPDSGHIRVHGKTLFDSASGIDIAPEHRHIGYVFQDARLFPHLSVAANLRYGMNRQVAAKRADSYARVVELLGLEHMLARRPGRLSGGEKQRVAIARALLSNPRILLMDEPLASLDAARKSDVLPYIERLATDFDVPVVYVSHAIEEVVRLSDTLVLIADGRVAAQGTVEDLMARLDLAPLTGRYEAGAVLTPTVAGHQTDHHLTRLSLLGHDMYVPALDMAPGTPVRLRVRARDVSLALTRPTDTSILNILACRVHEIETRNGEHNNSALDKTSHVEVALRVTAKNDGTANTHPQTVLARITRKSLHDLKLARQTPVYALIKAVAIDRHSLGGLGRGAKRTNSLKK